MARDAKVRFITFSRFGDPGILARLNFGRKSEVEIADRKGASQKQKITSELTRIERNSLHTRVFHGTHASMVLS
jgi:hypothetical protein